MACDYREGWYKTLIFIVVAPVMGLVMSLMFMVAVFWLLRNKAPRRIDAWFRKLQLLSAAAYSLGHGGNDAQKTMGIVASALYGAHYLSSKELAGNWGKFHWPIILAAHLSIALGTYFGGWRIVHTMGSRITKLKPVGGFCAEAAGAITLFSTALAGIPVSTTHTITGAIVGVGAAIGFRQCDGECAAHRLGLGCHHSSVGAGRRNCILDCAIHPPWSIENCCRSPSGRGRIRPILKIGRPAPRHRPPKNGSIAGTQSVSEAGSVNRKVEPWWSSLSARIVPPCARTICLAIASPRPVPPTLANELYRRDKIARKDGVDVRRKYRVRSP